MRGEGGRGEGREGREGKGREGRVGRGEGWNTIGVKVFKECGNLIINAKGGKHSERGKQMTEKL